MSARSTAQGTDGFSHLTLSRGLRTSAARVPEKPALVSEAAALTYAQLVNRMDRLGAVAAHAWGLGAGDVVALIAPNRLEYIEVVAGLSDLGVVVATLNPRLAPPELAAILADCRPKAALIDPALGALGQAAREAGVRVVAFGAPYEELLSEAHPGRSPGPVFAETSDFCLCYTSGTTGAPKGVLLPHRSRALIALAAGVEYGCFGLDDRFLALAPLYHGAGFAFAIAALSFGGTCVLFDGGEADPIVSRLCEGDISGVFMVPTHFRRIFDLPESTLASIRGRHKLKTIISNAAALAQPLKAQAEEVFGSGLLHESYGSTEAGIVTNIRPCDLARKPGSVGTPFIDMEVEIRRPNGSPCAPGEIGELFSRGPYTFSGYLNAPEATAQTIQDGWVSVQDLASMDEDGFITIAGRLKDMVISGGVNIYPAEIEAVIARLPGVSEVAVVGLPDAEWGERLHAFVVGEGGRTASDEEIINACRRELSAHKTPRGVTHIAELPRNASGKILKRELRAMDQSAPSPSYG